MARSPANEALRRVSEQIPHALAKTLGIVALYGGVINPVAEASVDKTFHPDVHQATFHTIPELPGYNLQVTPSQRLELRNSIVKVIKRWHGPDFPQPSAWEEECGGFKVSMPGSNTTGILTAGHCLWETTGSATGIFQDTSAPKNTAENYKPRNLEYAISHNNLLADVDISVDTAFTDVAMLKPTNSNVPYNLPTTGNAYNKIRAIPIEKLATKSHKPVLGEQVAVEGMPDANNNKPFSTTGRYIGRFKIPVFTSGDSPLANNVRPGSQQLVDCVAVNTPRTLEHDPYQPGSSGLSAVTASGLWLGPDSGHINTDFIPTLEQMSHIKLSQNADIGCYAVLPDNIGPTLLKGFK